MGAVLERILQDRGQEAPETLLAEVSADPQPVANILLGAAAGTLSPRPDRSLSICWNAPDACGRHDAIGRCHS